ncbi:hypothetical protein PM082_022515 [Marasmius tenuissimus]|nr:hypothetical protein PM082_022515 [Marasmius tenuissimus]
MSTDQIKQIVVLGAGVIGLTTAVSIQERGGFTVTVIADVLPTDPKSIRYTSHWAGAQHVTHTIFPDSERQKIERDTFQEFWKLSEQGGAAEACLMRIAQTEYFREKPEDIPMSWYPDFREIPKQDLVEGAAQGVEFTTVTIDSPRYLAYLLSRLLAAGGSITRGNVQHINEIVEGGAGVFAANKQPSPVDAVVVCTGLGTRNLGGIEDKEMYPIRGQTVLVKAPWIKFGRTFSGPAGPSHHDSYVIPRRSGDVVVGGTFGNDDWYPTARSETTEAILRRGLSLCPELAPPEIRAQRTPTVDDVRPLIVESGCGLRPARKGGIRLETLFFHLEGKEKKIPVVTNYGHAGAGFQSSWGSAKAAVGLLVEALS